MIGALIILLVTITVGTLLYVYDLKWRRTHKAPENPMPEEISKTGNTEKEIHGDLCCGRHLICEKSLVPSPDEVIVYYEDEELDRFAGRDMADYTPDEIEEIREVLLTLLPQDVAGWARSVQLRGISLPSAVRDELFILLEDCK